MSNSLTSRKIYIAAPTDVTEGLRAVEEAIADANDNPAVKEAGIYFAKDGWGNLPRNTFDEKTSKEIESSFIYVMILSGSMGPRYGVEPTIKVEWDCILRCVQRDHTGPNPVIYYKSPKFDPNQQNDSREFGNVYAFVQQIQDNLQKQAIREPIKTVNSLQEIKHLFLGYLTNARTLERAQKEVEDAVPSRGAWLTEVGLAYNPFHMVASETDNLILNYLYHREYKDFSNISATQINPPALAMILGEPGMGKTAMRRGTEDFVGQTRNPRYFVVSYDKGAFQSLLRLSKVTESDHVEKITLAGLRKLIDETNTLGSPPQLLEKWEIEMLDMLLNSFEGELTQPELRKFRERMSIVAGISNFEGIKEPDRKFDVFCTLIGSFGYDKPLILVDQVGKAELGDYDDEQIADFLAPLVRATRDTLSVKAHFRFFVDLALEPYLSTRQVLLDDGQSTPDHLKRITTYRLEYSHSELEQIIQLRLAAASQNPSQPIKGLGELFSTTPDLTQLIKATDGNPRKLISMCNKLIEEQIKAWNPDRDLDSLIPIERLDNLIAESTLRSKSLDKQVRSPNGALEEVFKVADLPPFLAVIMTLMESEKDDKKLDRAIQFIENLLTFCRNLLLEVAVNPQWTSEDETWKKKNNYIDGSPLPQDVAKSILLERPSAGKRRAAVEALLKHLNQTLPRRDLSIASSVDSPGLIFVRAVEHFFEYRVKGKGKPNKDRLSEIISWRNEKSHQHSYMGGTNLDTIDEYMEAIKRSLQPFCQLKMLLVEGVFVDPESRELNYPVRHLRGNNMVWSDATTMSMLVPPPAKNRIILCAPDSNVFVELYPLLAFLPPGTPGVSSPGGELVMLTEADQTIQRGAAKPPKFVSPSSPDFQIPDIPFIIHDARLFLKEHGLIGSDT